MAMSVLYIVILYERDIVIFRNDSSSILFASCLMQDCLLLYKMLADNALFIWEQVTDYTSQYHFEGICTQKFTKPCLQSFWCQDSVPLCCVADLGCLLQALVGLYVALAFAGGSFGSWWLLHCPFFVIQHFKVLFPLC